MTAVLGLSAVTVHVHRDQPVSWVVLSALRAATSMWCRMNAEPKTLSSITTDNHHDLDLIRLLLILIVIQLLLPVIIII